MNSLRALALSFTFAAAPALAEGPGMAMHGSPKYIPGAFHAYEYANPDAPKGGTVSIGAEGGFDTLNPFSVKGDAAANIEAFVFQTLGAETLDEPFSQYPMIAESFELAPDKLSMVVKLRKEAKFADGKPVTADDVVFSFGVFRSDAVLPFYKFYWQDIKELIAVDPLTVKMVFIKENPELALIATQLPVLPKHIYGKGVFGKDFTDKAIGSGPYVIKDFKRDSYVTFKRNPDFWGKDLPMFKGRYNFDEITVKYFKDPTAEIEAFKKGDFDMYWVNGSKVWALDLVGEKFDTLKYIKKELWPHSNDQGSQGFVFNQRLKMFQDIKVREAMALAFDFDWSNKNLFYGQYTESRSFFENSPLKATGMPTAAELKVLEPLKADLPPEVFTKEIGYLGKGMDIKDRLREAMKLLKEAGYVIKDGVATGPAGRLEFKFLMDSPMWQRIVEPYAQNLKKIGVLITLEQKEQSVYIKRVEARDFSMIVQTIGESQSPGNEQRDFWTQKAADENFSRNYGGVKNKAVDILVDGVIYAKSREELELMTKCLDRALYHLHPLVHNWHITNHRIAYWDKFSKVPALPKFYNYRQELEFMWYDTPKAKKLEEAKARGAPLL